LGTKYLNDISDFETQIKKKLPFQTTDVSFPMKDIKNRLLSNDLTCCSYDAGLEKFKTFKTQKLLFQALNTKQAFGPQLVFIV
jgi:hypothetical protein